MYQIANDVDLEKIRLSEGVIAKKHDTRYTIGYEEEPDKIVPLYLKTPRDCPSSRVTQYNESSLWKIGLNVGGDEAWIQQSLVGNWQGND